MTEDVLEEKKDQGSTSICRPQRNGDRRRVAQRRAVSRNDWAPAKMSERAAAIEWTLSRCVEAVGLGGRATDHRIEV